MKSFKSLGLFSYDEAHFVDLGPELQSLLKVKEDLI